MIDVSWFPIGGLEHASSRIRAHAVVDWLGANGYIRWSNVPQVSVSFKRLNSPYTPSVVRVLDLSDNHMPSWVACVMLQDAALADCVVVGSEEFARHLRKHVGRIEVIPDCVDPISGNIRRMPQDFVLWYGNWGSKHHDSGGLRDLPLAAEWLAGRKLHICSNSEAIAHEVAARLPCKSWSYSDWTMAGMRALLAMAESVIVPVSSTTYTRCKSHNRVTTAINAGVPVLASDLPAYREFGCITDWTNGAEPILVDKAKLAPYYIDVIGEKWRVLLEDLSRCNGN